MDTAALLPGAIGIAASPLTVASIVFLLGQRRGYRSAVACLLGWVAAIVVALVVAVLLGEQLPRPSTDGPPVQAIVALCAALLLLALAVWQWVRRRLPDGRPASSRWSVAIESVGPARAVALGALLFLSPKLFVLVFAAGLVFGEADPGSAEALVAGALFVLVSASTAILPIALAVVFGDHARRALEAVRRWIARWGSVSLVVVLVLLAAVQLTIAVAGFRASAG